MKRSPSSQVTVTSVVLMPQNVGPTTRIWPEEVDKVFGTLGSTGPLTVLLFLRDHSPATYGQIKEALPEAGDTTVHKYLKDAAAKGFVEIQPSSPEMLRSPILYSLNRQAVQRVIAAFGALFD